MAGERRDGVEERAQVWNPVAHECTCCRCKHEELCEHDLAAFAREERARALDEAADVVERLRSWSACVAADWTVGACAHIDAIECVTANLRTRAEAERRG